METREPSHIGVLCVDDNPLIGESLERRVAAEPSLRWLGMVCDGTRAEGVVRRLRPDVVLMDIDMPDVDTFGLVERISQELPWVRVVMLSGHVDVGYINRALDCGAWGYLSKNEDVGLLIRCIQRAAAGEIVLSPEVEEVHRRSQLHKPDSDPPPSSSGVRV